MKTTMILYNEIKKYLESIDTEFEIVDHLDDKDRRYHFKYDFFYHLSFKEESFNIEYIQETLEIYCNPRTKSFLIGTQELYDTLMPYLKSKERKEKIKKFLDGIK